MSYRLIKDFDGVQRITDGAFIPADLDNRDYKDYLKWLAKGHKPLPAVEPPPLKQQINPDILIEALSEMLGLDKNLLMDRIAKKLER